MLQILFKQPDCSSSREDILIAKLESKEFPQRGKKGYHLHLKDIYMNIGKYIDNVKKIFIKEENFIRRENVFLTKAFVHFLI